MNDVLVTTDRILARLKEYLENAADSEIVPVETCLIDGIQVMAYRDEDTARAAAVEMQCSGKRVILAVE